MESATQIFNADPEPQSYRLTLLMTFIGGTLISVISLAGLMSIPVCSPLPIFGGFLIGAGLMQIGEITLKPRWKSTTFVHLNPAALEIRKKGSVTRTIDPTQQVNVLSWHFTIERRARVPKGWHLVALALEQDSAYLPVYTLMSPETFEALPSHKQFTRLEKPKEKNGLPAETDLRRAGLQRRLQNGETARAFEGVELLPDDFSAYLTYLQTNFPQWMPE